MQRTAGGSPSGFTASPASPKACRDSPGMPRCSCSPATDSTTASSGGSTIRVKVPGLGAELIAGLAGQRRFLRQALMAGVGLYRLQRGEPSSVYRVDRIAPDVTAKSLGG